MTALRRIVTSVVMTGVILGVAAAPASAHTVSGQGATNYRTRLLSVSPALPGLAVRTVDLASFLEVTWTGSPPLVIQGYAGEPYLRIGPDGVYRNRLSPSTYLNVTRTYYATIPAYADAKAPPQWVKVSSGRTVLWHDHRIHWMGGRTPPEVAAAPGQFHHVFPWSITMTEGTTTVHVKGTLDWVPGSSPWGWVGLIVLLAVVGVVAGGSRRWAPALVALLAVLVGADIVHAVGTGLEVHGSVLHKVLLIFAGSYYSVVAWVLGAVAVRLLRRRSIDGLFAAVFTALVIGLFGGLADVVALARSQVPFLFGTVLDRLLISVSLGVGAGVVGGALLAFRRNRPPVDDGVEGVPGAAAVGTAGAATCDPDPPGGDGARAARRGLPLPAPPGITPAQPPSPGGARGRRRRCPPRPAEHQRQLRPGPPPDGHRPRAHRARPPQ
ncbi:MAG TPA: hypothetical protein VGI06_10215 [Acidimicrobiales bacterium]